MGFKAPNCRGIKLQHPCWLHILRRLAKMGGIDVIPPFNTRETDEHFAWINHRMHGCGHAVVRCPNRGRGGLLRLFESLLCPRGLLRASLLRATSTSCRDMVHQRSLHLLQLRSHCMRSCMLCRSRPSIGLLPPGHLWSKNHDIQLW